MAHVFQTQEFPNPLMEVNAWSKIDALESGAHQILMNPTGFRVPKSPARDIQILERNELSARMGLSDKEGRARLLHDLANIELQAMELGLRTLIEFPEAPQGFREELLKVTLEEGKHLRLCLEGLRSLDFEFGHWPVHLALWESVDQTDSLLDRVLIVHRYLEGSGLDASDLILKRLSGVNESCVKSVVKVIAEEEIGHVEFGSKWYKEIAKMEKLDPQSDFVSRLDRLKVKVPKRLVPISKCLRMQTGFSALEIAALESVQAYFREGQ